MKASMELNTLERSCRTRADADLRTALGLLGTLTGCRWVALVRLDGGEPWPLAYFDRDHPDAERPDAWPDAVRAACLVRDGRDGDGRLHAAGERSGAQAWGRSVVACQCVPVVGHDGEQHASLCVFDERPGRDLVVDLALLQRVAASLVAL